MFFHRDIKLQQLSDICCCMFFVARKSGVEGSIVEFTFVRRKCQSMEKNVKKYLKEFNRKLKMQ